MSTHTHIEPSIIAAKRIVPEVPGNLAGLQIVRRPTVGHTVRLCAVGDIGLSGRAAATAKHRGSETPVLHNADIAFGNLETPLASEIVPENMFAAPVTGSETLQKAGFNILHLANNHVGEYGQVV